MSFDLHHRIRLVPVIESDFDQLAALRVNAMQESLERVGRFNPERARERLRKSFYPKYTWHITLDGENVGFYTLRPIESGLQLDHFYIHPDFQSKGIGTFVMNNLIAEADLRKKAIHLGALKESRSNQFYQAHGFTKTSEDEFDTYYTRANCPLS